MLYWPAIPATNIIIRISCWIRGERLRSFPLSSFLKTIARTICSCNCCRSWDYYTNNALKTLRLFCLHARRRKTVRPTPTTIITEYIILELPDCNSFFFFLANTNNKNNLISHSLLFGFAERRF